MKKLIILVLGLVLGLSECCDANSQGVNSTALPQLPLTKRLPGAINILLNQEWSQYNNTRVYYALVQIAHPAQYVRMRFDTTARDIWLPGSDYKPEESESGKLIKENTVLQLDYDRDHFGDAYRDDFKFFEDARSLGEVQNQRAYSLPFAHRFFHARDAERGQLGAIGLSSKPWNDVGLLTYLLERQNTSQSTIFSLYLNSNLWSSEAGELCMGCYNTRRYVEHSLVTHKLVNRGEDGWKLPLNKVTLDNKIINYGNMEAILDTGRDFIRVPGADFTYIINILDAIEEGENWIVDCEKRIMKMTFNIDNSVYTIDGKSFLIDTYRSAKCLLNMKPWNRQEWSLGTSFLRTQYTIFDFGKKKVGFAVPKPLKNPRND